MSETCGGNCSSCGEACSERKPESLQAQPNPKSKIGKVIAVVSGKGGVGKSTVSAMLATAMQRTGRRAGVLDADITGPSIPKAFGVSECASADEEGIYPAVTESGIQIMSVNLLLEHEDDPVLWRGPIIAGAVKQFWTDVVWENVDYLFVDMPPGTSDVFLTVFQQLPVDGIVTVSAPQELVAMIVGKAVNLAKSLEVPVVVARNMDLPRAGVTTRPTVDTPMGKGKCMVTAASAAPLSSSSTILRWPASSSATGTVVTPSPSSVPM